MADKPKTKPRRTDRDEKGRWRKGCSGRAGQIKRVTATDILDIASDHLAMEYAGTKVEDIFKNGFSPVKEIMRMYAQECSKNKPDFDKRLGLLKSILPYIYPTMKSIEFDGGGELPTLKLVLADDDEPDNQGKGRNGNKVSRKAK